MALEYEVRQASVLFYDCLNKLLHGNPAPMLEICNLDDRKGSRQPVTQREAKR
jgi:hypothetical protein